MNDYSWESKIGRNFITLAHSEGEKTSAELAEKLKEYNRVHIIEYDSGRGGGGFGIDIPWESIFFWIAITIVGGGLQAAGVGIYDKIKELLVNKKKPASICCSKNRRAIKIIIPAHVSKNDLGKIFGQIDSFLGEKGKDNYVFYIYDKKSSSFFEMPREDEDQGVNAEDN